MNTVLILVSVVGVLYGLWLLMGFVFNMLDVRHALMREERLRAAEPRNNGAKRSGERSA